MTPIHLTGGPALASGPSLGRCLATLPAFLTTTTILLLTPKGPVWVVDVTEVAALMLLAGQIGAGFSSLGGGLARMIGHGTVLVA